MRISKLKIDSERAEFDLCRDIMKRYNIKQILGNKEISSEQKSVPGPTFPLDELRNHLLNSSRKDMDRNTDNYVPKKGIATVSALNIRSGLSVSKRTFAKPLSKKY